MSSRRRFVLTDQQSADLKTTISSRWTFHSGRIGGLAFSPNSKRLVSGGLDESIYIWSTEKQMKNIVIKVRRSQRLKVVLMAECTPRWCRGRCLVQR